jgi:hypothetical protein
MAFNYDTGHMSEYGYSSRIFLPQQLHALTMKLTALLVGIPIWVCLKECVLRLNYLIYLLSILYSYIYKYHSVFIVLSLH